MGRLVLALLLWLACACAASAQQGPQTSQNQAILTGLNQSVTLNPAFAAQTCTLTVSQVSNAQYTSPFVGSVTFSESGDGSTFTSLATVSAPGNYVYPCGGYYTFKATMSAYTSGAATVLIVASPSQNSAPYGGNVKQTFNVVAYGAFGDLVSDTTAIASAVSAMPSYGGILYFPPAFGTYLLPIETFTKSVDIACDGDKTTLSFPAQVTASPLLSWSAQSNVTVDSCIFDATNVTSSAAYGMVNFSNSGTNDNVTHNIFKMFSSGFGFAIVMQGINGFVIYDNTITQPVAGFRYQNEGVLTTGSGLANGHIDKNTLLNTGMDISVGQNIWLDGNQISNSCYGGGITDGVGTTGHYHYIGNEIHGCGPGTDSNGFNRQGIESYAPDTEIRGNYTDNNSYSGITVDGARSHVVGNESINNLAYGIAVGGNDVVIADNEVGNTASPAPQNYGIFDNSSSGDTGLSVTNNHAFGNNISPAQFAAGATGTYSADGQIFQNVSIARMALGVNSAGFFAGTLNAQGDALCYGTSSAYGCIGDYSGTAGGVSSTLFCARNYNTGCLLAADQSGNLGLGGSLKESGSTITFGGNATLTMSGNGAPTGSCYSGSLYERTDLGAAAGAVLYDCRAGAWYALSGG